MSKKNSFVKQASFLMIAGLLVRVIGLLYRPVMKTNIGELGYAYYGYAYNVYFILLLISGYSIPDGGVKTYVGAAGKETVSECTEGF